jgi:hypothetical protein
MERVKKSDIFVALSLTVLDIETPAGKLAGVFYCLSGELAVQYLLW